MDTQFLSIRNGALQDENLPSKLKILNFGANESQKGVFTVNADSLAAIQRQIGEKAFERLLIDFEHSSVPGTPAYTPPPRKHAGYGTLRAGPDGVWLDAIEWTPAGKEFAKEYSDLSPVVLHDGGVVTGITSVALCPNGALNDVTFFGADAPVAGKTKGQDMDEIKVQLAALSQSLADLAAKVAALEKPDVELETLTAKVGELSGAMAGEIKTQLAALAAKVESQQAAFAADLARRDKDALLGDAARDGKVIALSAEAIAKLSVEELRDHVSKVRATVPLAARTPAFVQDGLDAANGARQAIARNCGIDPAKVK